MAAFELVGEVGYERLTASRGSPRGAGVGKQTIYRWWPSKGVVLFDAFLALSENPEGEVALPDSGDLDADLKLVLRATAAELADPRYDLPMRALSGRDAERRGARGRVRAAARGPLPAAKRARLARRSGSANCRPQTDLDLAVDLLWSPLWRRWQDGGALTPAFADALVATGAGRACARPLAGQPARPRATPPIARAETAARRAATRPAPRGRATRSPSCCAAAR